MRRSFVCCTLGLALGVGAAFAPACARFEGAPEPLDGAPDGTTEAGADARPPLGCSTVYVSVSKGDDANDGCSQDKPLKTLARALSDAPQDARIYVCAGVYREPQLTLQRRLSMYGGFNCTTWEHGAGYGHAGGFKDVNLTRIENGAYASNQATFTIRGAEVGADSIVEGFTFAGSEEGTLGGIGVNVTEKAAPTLRDVEIVGGGTTSATGTGTIGLAIQGGAAPEVKDSRITGGSGTSSVTAGSTGIRIGNATANIHDCTVDGGAGVGTHGAVGILLDSSAADRPARIANNTVTWGAATSTSANGRVAVGIQLGREDVVTLDGNLIRSSVQGSCSDLACVTMGVLLVGKNKVVSNNRIQPGDVRNASGSSAYGIQALQAEGVVVTGNVIHMAARTNPANAYLEGVALYTVKGATVAGNTIVMGLGATSPNRIGIRAVDSTNVVADGNVLVGNAPTAGGWDTGFSGCRDNYQSIRSNLFVTTKQSFYALGGCAAPAAATTGTVSDFEAAFPMASGNKTLTPGCANASCVSSTCPLESSCWTSLFATFDLASFGSTNVAAANGFALSSGASCAIARGWTMPPAAATLAVDLYAAPRTLPFAMGAAEYDGVCVP
ncbi:MAG: right-handed parallel beta-helix repeat-containing protein [Deltaproteobacteria bacterium]|nr:right-handed parallel beta-helix repeat-containing protein [Deltaproteobacteria bacterium]